MLNGVTRLIMMKADVLDHFDSIKVATSYIVDGKESNKIPFDTEAEITPVYKEFKGWNRDLTGVRAYNDLPVEFTTYIDFIEKYIGVKIAIISLGPDREQTIIR